MKRESKQAKQMSSLWNVSLKFGRLKTAIVAPFPIKPQIPTMTDKIPSQTMLQEVLDPWGIPMQSISLSSSGAAKKGLIIKDRRGLVCVEKAGVFTYLGLSIPS